MAKRRLQKKEKFIREVVSKTNGKKTFQFEFRYTDLAGNEARETKSFSEKEFGSAELAKRAAVNYRDEFIRTYERLGIPVKKKTTLDELFEKKFELFPKSVKTRKHHKSYYRNYIQPAFGEREIKTIKADEIQINLNSIAAEKSDDMISAVLGIWRELFKTAIFLNMITLDQTVKVIKPKSKALPKKKHILSNVPSIDYVCDKIRENSGQSDMSFYNGEILIYAIKVMHLTGIRPAECFALSRDDIDLEYGLLTIQNAVGSNLKVRKTLIPTKTKESNREIPIVPQLKSIFEELLDFTDNFYLFQDWNGEFLEIDNVSTKIHNIFKNTPYHFNLYNLRHQFATDLTLNKTDLRTIQDLMGHTDASMTLSYARSNKESQTEALERRFRS